MATQPTSIPKNGNRHTRLELTWIGKENRPRLEPRILLEDAKKSYHAAERRSDNDIFDNRLIFGDNLLALKALEQEFTGKVKAIFIDPPYNTGSAFGEYYDDGVEHSIWLSLMRDRLELLRRLLNDRGSIWITIDDNEAHYLKVICDEVFGRSNFITSVVWQKTLSVKNSARHFSADHFGSFGEIGDVQAVVILAPLAAGEYSHGNLAQSQVGEVSCFAAKCGAADEQRPVRSHLFAQRLKLLAAQCLCGGV